MREFATRVIALLAAAAWMAGPSPAAVEGVAVPAVERDRQTVSVEKIRSIGAALEAYVAAKGTPPIVASGPVTIEFLRPLLQAFLPQPPLEDPWGHPYLYWSDGRDYIVVGTGGNGEDRAYAQILPRAGRVSAALDRICLGARERPEADIVFTRGLFCQWPRGLAGQ